MTTHQRARAARIVEQAGAAGIDLFGPGGLLMGTTRPPLPSPEPRVAAGAGEGSCAPGISVIDVRTPGQFTQWQSAGGAVVFN